MTSVILDTDTYSEILRGKNANVLAWATADRRGGGKCSYASITLVEIARGFHRSGRLEKLHEIMEELGRSEVLTLDRQEALLAGRILADLDRNGTPIGWADPLIAAVAITHDRVLVSGNISHYDRIVRLGHPLRLENWRDPPPKN